MTKVRIKLLRMEAVRGLYEVYHGGNLLKFVNENRNFYVSLPPIVTDKTGIDAAEEMFDLTNNPSRQDEREELYGNGRSVSVGDIVEVDGVDYLCSSFGWKVVG